MTLMLLAVGLSGCNELDPLPTITVFASKVTGYEPLEVSFTLDSDSDESIQSYYWNFGDGYTSAEKNPTHIFWGDGDCIVQVMVTDKGGRVVTEIINISVMKSIKLQIKHITGTSKDDKVTSMLIVVQPMVDAYKNHSINLKNITIELDVYDEHVSLIYSKTAFYSMETVVSSDNPILYNLKNNEFGIWALDDEDGSCTKNSPVANYGDNICLTVNFSSCLGGVPPRTFVNGTVGNRDGVIDDTINFRTPIELGCGGIDLQ
jgi:PKD repeat protein